MADALEIYCDESGNTGPALLDPDQKFFGFSSVAITDAEARDLVARARSKFPVQMPELKAAKLVRTTRGLALLGMLVEELKGKFAVCVHDKLLALCANFFEYTFEPVFRESPWLLYEKGLGKYVAMVCWTWLKGSEAEAQQAVEQFQQYLRTLDEKQAPLLFESVRTPIDEAEGGDPFELILRFTRGYREKIIADNAQLGRNLPDGGRWVLDLATTSMFSHLNHWGQKGRPLLVRCDDSKPLKAMMPSLSGGDGDAGIGRARAKGFKGPLGWAFASPPEFVSSNEHAGVQLADILAGAIVLAVTPGALDLGAARDLVLEHALPYCIGPELELVDPSRKGAAVNAAVLWRLAEKAEKGISPYERLAFDYEFVEAMWDEGHFRLGS
jgi:hypothetical protein